MIYFNGDSFTYGLELDDVHHQRYSAIICNHFDEQEINDAIGGASNQRIVRTTFESLATYDNIKLVSIMWTDLSRYEHYVGNINCGEEEDGWRRILVKRLCKKTGKTPAAREYSRKYNNVSVMHTNKILLNYSAHVRTTEHMIYEFLHQILQIQQICNAKNIPCIMSFAFNNPFQESKNLQFAKSLPIYNKIDWTEKTWLDNNVAWNMKAECLDTNQVFGNGGHPLASGHYHIAKKFIDKIKLDK